MFKRVMVGAVLFLAFNSFAATYTFSNGWINDGEWTELTNWSPSSLPGSGDDVILTADANTNSGATPTVNSLVVNSAGFNIPAINISGTATFNWTSLTSWTTITANLTVFNDSASPDGSIIIGNAEFYDTTNNDGDITGTVYFYDNSNHGNIITGNVYFFDESHSGGTISGDVIFNDKSYNQWTINGNATFRNNLYNNLLFEYTSNRVGGSVNGNACFSTGATNLGFVSGTVTTCPTMVNSIYSTPLTGTFGVGWLVTVNILFSENITVTGVPQLTLETGVTDAVVDLSATGPSGISFDYTVSSGETSSDLDYLATNSLTLNGGTIQDGALNNADLTLPLPGSRYSLSFNSSVVANGITPNFYFSWVDGDWANVNNWWSNSAYTIPAGSIPTITDNVIINDTTNVISTISSGTASVNAVFFGNYTNNQIQITVADHAEFDDQSYMSGAWQIIGDTIFNGGSHFDSGVINGSVVFNDTSRNAGGSVTGGVGLTAVFNDNTSNCGNITKTTTFNDNSVNNGWFPWCSGVIFGNATFNNNSYNIGLVSGTGTFNTTYYGALPAAGIFPVNSHDWYGTVFGTVYGSDLVASTIYQFSSLKSNYGTVNVNAHFACGSVNYGTVNGTITSGSCAGGDGPALPGSPIDNTPLAISNIRASFLETSATVTFDTSKNAAGSVRYTTASGILQSVIQINTPKTSHSFSLSGLTPCTRYFYWVDAIASGVFVSVGTLTEWNMTFITAGTCPEGGPQEPQEGNHFLFEVPDAPVDEPTPTPVPEPKKPVFKPEAPIPPVINGWAAGGDAPANNGNGERNMGNIGVVIGWAIPLDNLNNEDNASDENNLVLPAANENDDQNNQNPSNTPGPTTDLFEVSDSSFFQVLTSPIQSAKQYAIKKYGAENVEKTLSTAKASLETTIQETVVVAKYSLWGVSALIAALFLSLNVLIFRTLFTTTSTIAGETLQSIATKYNMTERALIQHNPSLKYLLPSPSSNLAIGLSSAEISIPPNTHLKVRNRPFLEKDYLDQLKFVLQHFLESRHWVMATK